MSKDLPITVLGLGNIRDKVGPSQSIHSVGGGGSMLGEADLEKGTMRIISAVKSAMQKRKPLPSCLHHVLLPQA